MQSCHVARKSIKIVAQSFILEGFGVTSGSLWAPNGTPEAVFSEVNILMKKGFGNNGGEPKTMGKNGGGVPLKQLKSWSLGGWRLGG